jgi:SAM-dependent methyltransferase
MKLRATYPVVDGIHRCLSPERAEHYAQFLQEYTAVRHAEGRATDDPAYFRRLPEPTPGGPIEWQWKIRRRTWATARKKVLSAAPPALTVIDVGAGLGWLSNRASELGHEAHAVDITVDPADGLGAARHFLHPFERYQAEMDDLPFADGIADLVIYNASLHYSTDYTRTLTEGLRVLKPGGRLVVLDSPIYRTAAAGQAMVAERHAQFERQYGTRSEAVPSIEFVTDGMLDDLAAELSIRWRSYRTWYGWQWAMRPWKARWHKKRPPSRFEVLVATRRPAR